ncbi:hydroxyectoine utilization dehydratase EutB [Paracoccus shanxieyensis]|uniref:Hydroxyectoine utilization dehydratase EutB n=1 Tax=Paracoccus shanxieyensis TaxID=2675752 RepID=A0A6L6IUR2_9RHOB|nr:hydroxyectoine utilization dehydratase EutB [Paracoccus shanxieyensis]MTH63923.1 hydroxyectoine utilization dehydratase EutB [Paracoccus shanxieyensis]MTH87036.1 hydroxyectoine utilization dehydratase EutB [Paracoccus shanxieyensis]
MSVTLDDIRAASARIRGHVAETPLLRDDALSARLGQPVLMKCEYAQPTGAFKLRGATNAILSLGDARGVVTASTGNHGRALAHAARALGLPATVCLSRLVPANKVDAIRALGAQVRIIGDSQDQAMAEVARAVTDDGLTQIPPFDHADVIAGQGTIGLEIGQNGDWPDAVLVPLSGGGLAAGIAVAIKAISPATRVIGISMENGAAMAASLRAGHPVEVTEVATLADSLGGGIGLDNRLTFALCRDLLDGVLLVSEAEIAAAIRHLGQAGHMVEGAGAVGHAALLSAKFTPQGPTVTILSGGNIDPALHARLMEAAA